MCLILITVLFLLFCCSQWCSVQWCTEMRLLTPSPHNTWRSMPWQQLPTRRHRNMFIWWLLPHIQGNCFTLFTNDTYKQLINITSADSNSSLISCQNTWAKTSLQWFGCKLSQRRLLKVHCLYILKWMFDFYIMASNLTASIFKERTT